MAKKNVDDQTKWITIDEDDNGKTQTFTIDTGIIYKYNTWNEAGSMAVSMVFVPEPASEGK